MGDKRKTSKAYIYCLCGAITNTKDVRGGGSENVIRRRRECPDCKEKFTTVERVVAGAIGLPKGRTKQDSALLRQAKETVLAAYELLAKQINKEQAVVDKLRRFIVDIETRDA